jgi:predicted O-methyltransferase YrrM
MDPIIADILRSLDAEGRGSGISTEEGEFLQSIVEEIKPRISLEIGFAYGISALFICASLQKVKGKKHIVVDPSPFWSYKGIGFRNIQKAKYDNLVNFINAPSEMALPDLLKKETHIDFAFIDGWHTFDHALIDFFYINRMLNVGGVVAFDDANWPSISKLCRYVSRYPCYKIHAFWPARRIFGARTIMMKTLEYVAARQVKSWKDDLSIFGRRCVAFRKVREDDRKPDWYREF